MKRPSILHLCQCRNPEKRLLATFIFAINLIKTSGFHKKSQIPGNLCLNYQVSQMSDLGYISILGKGRKVFGNSLVSQKSLNQVYFIVQK
jgi:hypothetical protein